MKQNIIILEKTITCDSSENPHILSNQIEDISKMSGLTGYTTIYGMIIICHFKGTKEQIHQFQDLYKNLKLEEGTLV
jgi:hypothetical protein